MKRLTFIAIVLLSVRVSAQVSSDDKSADFRLIMEQESAYDFELQDMQKSEWILDPEVSYKWNDKLKFFGQLRLYSEFTDQLEPGQASFSNYSDFSRPLLMGDKGQLELRELYADISMGKTYWRVGKQQVVWGQMDGFKILDQLNPMSFREFILDDFDDSRIPLWAIKGDIKWRNFSVKPFWSPDLTTHQLPTGGLYMPALGSMDLPVGIAIEQQSVEVGNKSLFDSDYGIQVSTLWKGWDLSLNYLNQYSKMPVVSRQFDMTTNTLTFKPTQYREEWYGGSFGKTKGSFGFRGELSYIPRKHFTNTIVGDIDGISHSDQMLSGLAVDYFGMSDAIITFQWFVDRVAMDQSEMKLQRDQSINTVTMMLTKYLVNQQFEVKAFFGYRLKENGSVLDIKTSYLLKDNVKLWVGGDFFDARNLGLISSFSSRDRIYIGMEWGIQSKNSKQKI